MADLFFIRFLISSLISSALIVAILLIKKVFHKHISVKWQYNLCLLFLAMLIIPFIPSQFFNFGGLYNWAFNQIHFNGSITATTNTLNTGANNLLYSESWLQDFTMSVSRSTPQYFNIILIGIWGIGMFIYLIVTVLCNRDIKKIKQSVQPIDNNEIVAIFEKCKTELNISRTLILGESALVDTPMAVGFFKTFIILPTRAMKQLSKDDVYYIVLHELHHYKNKDILINYAMCFFQILYWFNPLVYLAFKEMRTDREIACDASVLNALDKSSYINYGMTIINFAERLSQSSRLTVATEMGGSEKQIKKRIEKIASFTIESSKMKIKSIGIFVLVGLLIFSQAPAISAWAYENTQYNFQETQVAYEDLSSYFDNFEGSFVLYNMQTDEYSIYNKDRSITRVSPDSTYKIYSSLIALETGVVQENSSERNWDGTNYPYDAWNHKQDLSSAMKGSVSWYFQNLDKSVGQRELQNYFDRMGYGNHNISGGISDYWMESSLLISPVEQVQLLKDFYTNDTIFSSENVDAVKKIIKLSEKNGAILSGKTGTGTVNGKGINGWFIGYVEKDGHTYIFATNIQDKRSVSGSIAAKITLSILSDKNIY